MANGNLKVRVKSMTWECADVLRIVVEPLEGLLPEPEPGAHVDFIMKGRPARQYSLTVGSSVHQYVFGVRKNPDSRGGSKAIHEQLRPGEVLELSAPRNAFPLVEEGPVHLVAGGIGITPLLYMAQVLRDSGRAYSFDYYCRSRDAAAFAAEVEQLGGQLYTDEEHGRPDLKADIGRVDRSAHLYCCGPAPMLDAFIDICQQGREEQYIHYERFGAAPLGDSEGSFVLELAKSGLEFEIPADKSILDTLIESGLSPEHNCCAGMCGECEVKVLSGEVDHRDMLLTDAEKEAGAMLICCSRSISDRLVVDM